MQGKKIIVGITGGIAAYKSAELVRLLVKCGALVKVIMTKSAQEFITPLTMQTLSQNAVHTDMFQQRLEANIEHIALARWADAIVVAPASANFMARLAHGFADDLLATVCLATTAPIAIAPAMNKEMWAAQATQNNLEILRKRGVRIFGPASGELACGEIGSGKMLEAQQIFELIPEIFEADNLGLLKGRKLVITAGPTRESIDPVRYISSHSSGKMGYAIAEESAKAGAEVVLISGPTNLPSPAQVKRIDVISAREMHDSVMVHIKNCDIFVSAAAVSDYAPVEKSVHKLKRAKQNLCLNLKLNPDILADVAALPNRPSLVIGFAAETENVLENAAKKLTAKNLDMIIANQVGERIGFYSDENELLLLHKNADPIELPLASKRKLAQQLVKIMGAEVLSISLPTSISK